MSHVLDLLPERALGVLDEPTRARVDAHLASCPSCAAEARAWEATGLALADVLPKPEAPSTIRARLLAAAEANGRLAKFTDAVARVFEIPIDKARALLDAADAEGAWEAGPLPGVALMHLKGGPALAKADTGLVRFPAGIAWPLHKHLGAERMLVLEGTLVDDTGRTWREGELLELPPGSQHAFDVLPGHDCLCAVVLHGGLEMPPGTPVVI